eukprot:TRINITY_DN121839_c0_g1_i1.p1 TRINITY_DN121839_c0_g1~~TRINITY_DN121839_c0_g1_i1.p1  ORF type:complete len:467 (+),score=133.01 TRINITY_DN121839_c0_g1_i1:106-1506(+)
MNAALKRQFEESNRADEYVQQAKKTRGREVGTCLDFDKGKGFGFLRDADGEKIFVHQSQIVATGFRRLEENQKVSFTRGENRGKPWAEDVRNPDGTPIVHEDDSKKPREEDASLAKKRRQKLAEQWRNFFDIPQYALKGYAETLPAIQANQDEFILGEAVPQLGKVFVMAHGCAAAGKVGNECSKFLKEKLAKFITKAYEDSGDTAKAIAQAFEVAETEWMTRAKMKSFTDGAEVTVALLVHALDASGRPCVQLWAAGTGTSVLMLCSADGTPVRILEPHATKKHSAKLQEIGFEVKDDGETKVAFTEDGAATRLGVTQQYRLPATRLIGGRPFKTTKAMQKGAVSATPDIKKAKEWRCVAGEELFLLMCSAEVMSVLTDQVAMNVALDAWGSSASGLDGWEAAAKAVVRTAQAQGPALDTLCCLAAQFWWQEKPLQRLLARRADQKKSGVPVTAKPKDDVDDMFG